MPHLDLIRDPDVLRAELTVVRNDYNTIRLLLFYSPEEIEAIARSLEVGFYRPAVLAGRELEHFEDDRDGEAVRVAAYSGCAWASSWRCAGATSTGPARR